MAYTIAITGKGGTGKTTIAALFVRQLIAADKKPVLAVDADPNTCLDMALGVKAEKTVGRIREEARELASKGMSAGISKQEMLQMKIAESLVESEDFDLIAMGRSEGPGCYCYANNVLKAVLGELAGKYPYIVIDNEAGLENLSRRIVQKVDLLVMVTDPSSAGIRTVCRLKELACEMGITFDRLVVIVNRLRDTGLSPVALSLKNDVLADEILGLSFNNGIAVSAEDGRPVTGDSKTIETIRGMILKYCNKPASPAGNSHQ